jgi:dTDP-4-dehydrorhamnose 3,5-epimerase
MKFSAAPIEGAWLIDLEPHHDERGFFARTWCRQELAAHGLETEIAQESLSHNRQRGTLRGLHVQQAPHEETKIVRCPHGRVFDVIVDVRTTSTTYKKWFGVELSAENRRAIYIPPGVAHGFQTLSDDTDVAYLISEFHTPAAARGARYDDPAFDVAWPLAVSVISERDLNWPDFEADLG